MNSLHKLVTVAAASAALGIATLGTSPAAAQVWFGGGYGPGWRGGYVQTYGWGPGPYGPAGYGPYGYGPYGYGDNWVSTGVTDIAICPPGYYLGRSGRLCWPE
jgi:hypothetical protein